MNVGHCLPCLLTLTPHSTCDVLQRMAVAFFLAVNSWGGALQMVSNMPSQREFHHSRFIRYAVDAGCQLRPWLLASRQRPKPPHSPTQTKPAARCLSPAHCHTQTATPGILNSMDPGGAALCQIACFCAHVGLCLCGQRPGTRDSVVGMCIDTLQVDESWAAGWSPEWHRGRTACSCLNTWPHIALSTTRAAPPRSSPWPPRTSYPAPVRPLQPR